jgi:hypothetical protein
MGEEFGKEFGHESSVPAPRLGQGLGGFLSYCSVLLHWKETESISNVTEVPKQSISLVTPC